MNDSGPVNVPTICSNCWYENERVVYNVNGRCDFCNGVSWIEAGEAIEEELPTGEEDLPGMWEASDFQGGRVDTEDDAINAASQSVIPSAREFAREQTDKLRSKKHDRDFINREGFFKDG